MLFLRRSGSVGILLLRLTFLFPLFLLPCCFFSYFSPVYYLFPHLFFLLLLSYFSSYFLSFFLLFFFSSHLQLCARWAILSPAMTPRLSLSSTSTRYPPSSGCWTTGEITVFLPFSTGLFTVFSPVFFTLFSTVLLTF